MLQRVRVSEYQIASMTEVKRYLEGMTAPNGDDDALPRMVDDDAVGSLVETIVEVSQHKLRSVWELSS